MTKKDLAAIRQIVREEIDKPHIINWDRDMVEEFNRSQISVKNPELVRIGANEWRKIDKKTKKQ